MVTESAVILDFLLPFPRQEFNGFSFVSPCLVLPPPSFLFPSFLPLLASLDSPVGGGGEIPFPKVSAPQMLLHISATTRSLVLTVSGVLKGYASA